MKSLILSALLWLGVITPPHSLIISGYDPGGDVSTYLTWLDRFAKTGVPVVLDGACVSACTFVVAMFDPDKICVTPRASLGIHQASTQNAKGQEEADPDVTKLLQVTFYPPWLQKWITDYETTTGKISLEVVYVRYDELSKHYRTCTASEAPIASSI